MAVLRDRGQASDFNAALDDHRSYLRRKSEAAKLTQAYENEKANEAGETGGSGKDLSIKGTIHINMNKVGRGRGSSFARGSWGAQRRIRPVGGRGGVSVRIVRDEQRDCTRQWRA